MISLDLSMPNQVSAGDRQPAIVQHGTLPVRRELRSGETYLAFAQQALPPGPLSAQPASTPGAKGVSEGSGQAKSAPQVNPVVVDSVTGEVYGAFVPYKPPAAVPVQLGNTPPTHEIPQPQVTDVLPRAHYVPNAKGRPATSLHPDIAAANAAAIRRKQSTPPPVTGESRPPADDYSITPTQGVQYTTPTGQTAQPAIGATIRSAQPANDMGASSSSQTPSQTPSQDRR